MVSPVKVAAWMAASLYHARSITKLHSCLAPLLVISSGLFAIVSRFLAAHSSKHPAQSDRGMSRGDQVRECMLKSPIIRVGMTALILISKSF